MLQSTHNDFFSDSLGFLIDGLCAPTTPSTAMEMNDRECDDDDNFVSEDRTHDTGFRLDLAANQYHYMCERDDEFFSFRESPRRSPLPLSPTTKSCGDGTQVTAALTCESSFDINDALSTEMNYESNSIFRSEEISGVNNSIFRPTQDYDFERREQHANLVRMKQANYQLEEPAPRPSRPRRVLTDPLNRRPASPTQLKYPDKKMKEEAQVQFLRQRAEQEQHSVIGRAA
jgi:hypothetical protein